MPYTSSGGIVHVLPASWISAISNGSASCLMVKATKPTLSNVQREAYKPFMGDKECQIRAVESADSAGLEANIGS